MVKTKSITSKFVRGLGIASLLFLCNSQQHLKQEFYNNNHPTPFRQEFQQRFGFPINGTLENVENSYSTISNIIEVLKKEHFEMEPGIRKIEVRNPDFWNQSLIQQIGQKLFVYSSYGDPITLSIEIEKFTSKETLHHEIKHIKTYQIIKKHPEFLSRWIAWTTSQDGKNQYRCSNWLSYAIHRLKLSRLFRTQPSDDCAVQGFVSEYASEFVYEDIAELCSQAEETPALFWVFIYKKPNSKIIGKIKLAQEYKLIPPEFSEFVLLENNYFDCFEFLSSLTLNSKNIDEFMSQSQEFLIKHPCSVYEPGIRERRGYILMLQKEYNRAVEEYKMALKSPFKNSAYLSIALSHLGACYFNLKEKEKSEKVYQISNEFNEKINLGDLETIINGPELPSEI